MDFEQIQTALDDGVLTITLNRPERLNAWTATMGAELAEAFDRADADDEVRVIVVTGAGRGFCAGADLASGGETFDFAGREPEDEVHRDGGGRFTLRVFESLKPVIAAINGPAVGVGATMTLPMDIRLAAEDARIGFVFARRGIVPEACSSWFLPRLVGISRAMEWVATGRVFSAREAHEAGLVRSLHPAQELLAAALDLAHEIADNTAPVPRECAPSWRSELPGSAIGSAMGCRTSCPAGGRRALGRRGPQPSLSTALRIAANADSRGASSRSRLGSRRAPAT
jgi:enoyl-CoA hydratase/carnithine racemase